MALNSTSTSVRLTVGSINFNFYQPLATHTRVRNRRAAAAAPPWMAGSRRANEGAAPQPKAKVRRAGGLVFLLDGGGSIGIGAGSGHAPPSHASPSSSPAAPRPCLTNRLGSLPVGLMQRTPALQLQPARTLAPRPCCTELALSYPMTSSRIFSLKRADEKRAGRRIALFDC